jgi:hypothetical protein
VQLPKLSIQILHYLSAGSACRPSRAPGFARKEVGDVLEGNAFGKVSWRGSAYRMDSNTRLGQQLPLASFNFLQSPLVALVGFVAALAYLSRCFGLAFPLPFPAAFNPSLSPAARSAAAAIPSAVASNLTVRLARSLALAMALSSPLAPCCAFWVALSFLSRVRW